MTHFEPKSAVAPPNVVYAIDIGIYRHRRDGQIRSETTFAWARVEAGICLVRRDVDFGFSGAYSAGRDIRALAEEIRRDVLSGTRIGIGIEAPMWQPAPTDIPTGAFDLFPIRFEQERGFAWYLQSGASALARAISTGRLLFSLLETCADRIHASVTPSPDANVELFEGFVVDKWKLAAAEELAEGPHAWDALTAAAAYSSARCGTHEPIHRAGSFGGDVLSHWATVLHSCDMDDSLARSDCHVVGFDSSLAS